MLPRLAATARLVVLTLCLLASTTTTAHAAPGALDPAFDGDGIKRLDVVPGTVPANIDVTHSLDLGDGRVIVGGKISDDFFLARFLADGTLDPAFGDLRRYDANMGSSPDEIGGLAVDASGRLMVAGRAANNAFLIRVDTNGDLDGSFGVGGRVIETESGPMSFSDVAITTGDGILATTRGLSQSRVHKYTSAGATDMGYGLGGISYAATDMNNPKIAVDGSGRILVGSTISGADYRVYRLDQYGAYDISFDGDGVADVTTANGDFLDLEVDSSNRPVLLGENAGDGFELARLADTGVLDAAFDSDGLRLFNPVTPGQDVPRDMVLVGTKIYVGGETDDAGDVRGFISAFQADGSPNSAFFGAGATATTTCDAGGGDCPITHLSTTGGTLAWTAKETPSGGNGRVLVGKVDFAGSVVNAFGGDGQTHLAYQAPWGSQVIDSAIAGDGSIYTVGEYGPYNDESTYIHKQLADGSPDATFGAAGTIAVDLAPGSSDYTSGLAVAGDGSVFVSFSDLSLVPVRPKVARFTASGLDVGGTFGTGGVATMVPTANDCFSGSVAIDATGRLLLGGTDYPPGVQRTWIGRYSSTTGAFDATFNAGSAFVHDFTGDSGEWLASVGAFDGDAVLAAVRAGAKAGVIKLTSGGTASPGFGTGGVVESSALGTVGSGEGVHAAAQGDGVVIGSTVSDIVGYKIVLARLGATGAVDASFGGGSVIVDTGPAAEDRLEALAIDSAGRSLVAGRSRGGGNHDTLFARITSSGALDTAVDGDGIVVSEHSGAYKDDYLTDVFERSGRIVGIGSARDRTGADLLLTVQMLGDPTPDTPTVPTPDPVDNCTPARKRLTKYKKLLKKQKKQLRMAKSTSRKKKLRKAIKKTKKRVSRARRAVTRYCTT